MVACGVALACFVTTVFCDVVTRDDRPAVAVAAGSDERVLHLRRVPRHCRRRAAQRSSAFDRDHRGDGAENAPGLRDDEPRSSCSFVGIFMVYFGAVNFSQGFGSFRMPSTDADRALVCGDPDQRLFRRAVHAGTIGQRLAPRLRAAPPSENLLNNALILGLMTGLFLVLGYSGVPVAFALMAGVFVGTLFTPISLPSIVGQLFNGIDSEALMAIPFFLLVGELMTSANIVIRIVNLSQALVGHMRGGLAQVVTVFSMFFSGMSGSSSADVAVLSRTMAKPMAQEGYSPAFVAALIAAASTIANMVPPSIMAVVYGAIGNVSIAGLFLGGIVPGVMIGLGLMIYCYFFGPTGFRRPRASSAAARHCHARRGAHPVHPSHPARRHFERLVHADGGRRHRGRLHPLRRHPAFEPRTSQKPAARFRSRRHDLHAADDHHCGGLGFRLDAGLFARPDRGCRLDRALRRRRSDEDHVRACRFVRHRRRLHRADPGDRHLHAGRQPADRDRAASIPYIWASS